MNIFDDSDSFDFARRCAREEFNKYSTRVESLKLEYEDMAQEACIVILEIREKYDVLKLEGDLGPYCKVAIRRRLAKVIADTSIVKMPDVKSKSYNERIANYYVAGNEMSIDADEKVQNCVCGISSPAGDFTNFVHNRLMVEQVYKGLSKEDREELIRYMKGLCPVSKKRRQTLFGRCDAILQGKNPYKTSNKYPGVSKVKEGVYRGYYVTRIDGKKVKKNVGTFRSEEEAYEAVCRAKELVMV